MIFSPYPHKLYFACTSLLFHCQNIFARSSAFAFPFAFTVHSVILKRKSRTYKMSAIFRKCYFKFPIFFRSRFTHFLLGKSISDIFFRAPIFPLRSTTSQTTKENKRKSRKASIPVLAPLLTSPVRLLKYFCCGFMRLAVLTKVCRVYCEDFGYAQKIRCTFSQRGSLGGLGCDPTHAKHGKSDLLTNRHV